MERGSKFCPEHPDEKVVGFQNECRACNKPLQNRKAYTEKPDPPKVEDLENTVYDPRVEDPGVEKEKRIVAHRLAELAEDPLTDEDMKPIVEANIKGPTMPELEGFKEGLEDLHKKVTDKMEESFERQPLTPEKITAAPEPRPFKTFREKIEEKSKAKIEEKRTAKQVVPRSPSYGETSKASKKGKR